MRNSVLARLNQAQLDEHLDDGWERLGSGLGFTLCLPDDGRQGQTLAGHHQAALRRPARSRTAPPAGCGMRIAVEPSHDCALDDLEVVRHSTFGESHYLDFASDDRVCAMRHIEAELSAFAERRRCTVLRRCSGVAWQYARRYGDVELVPFAYAPAAAPPSAAGGNEARHEP